MTNERRPRAAMAVVVLVALTLSCSGARGDDPWVTDIESRQYFAVSVEDVDASVAWYAKVLGVRKLDDNEAEDKRWRIVNMRSDRLSIELIRDSRAEDAERPRGFFKVGFQVADVDRVADRVEKATGERPRVLPFPQHGIRILQLNDPDGNTIQLFSPLSAEAGTEE